jgi:hypothetical protein
MTVILLVDLNTSFIWSLWNNLTHISSKISMQNIHGAPAWTNVCNCKNFLPSYSYVQKHHNIQDRLEISILVFSKHSGLFFISYKWRNKFIPSKVYEGFLACLHHTLIIRNKYSWDWQDVHHREVIKSPSAGTVSEYSRTMRTRRA